MRKTATDTWDVFTDPTSAATATSSSVGTLAFDVNGQLTSGSPLSLTVTSPNATIGTFTVSADVATATQFGSAFGVSNLTQDGYAPGELTSLKIGTTGVITATYSNGQTQSAGQVALADFRNVQGLTPLGGGNWVETFASGQPIQGAPGQGKLGGLRAGALEESNVDLTAELVSMMTAQRNYQANAQTIKTQDQVMSTLVNLR
jgi:flagellar hook protein FlgE